MRFLIDFVRSWFMIARANRHTFALIRKCMDMENERIYAEKRLEEAMTDAASVYANIRSSLATAQQTIQQYDDTVKNLRSEAKTRDLEIEIMVASHTRMLERYRTETAVDVQKRNPHLPPSDYGA